MKEIKGFEGYYINEEGEVFAARKTKTPTKMKSHKVGKGGHHQVSLYKDGKKFSKYVHRLVAETFLSNPNDKPEVCHKNHNVDDNRLENLMWGTHKRICLCQ